MGIETALALEQALEMCRGRRYEVVGVLEETEDVDK